MIKTGQIRVGRCTYSPSGARIDPSYPGFTNILVLTKSSAYGDLGPYVLKDKHGRIMENIWQSNKCYPKVPRSLQHYSRYDKTVIWDHPAEVHCVKNANNKWEIQPAYFEWREKLGNNVYPVRYPVTFSPEARASCLFSIPDVDEFLDPNNSQKSIGPKPRLLNYVQARKEIYMKVYIELVKERPQFKELKERLAAGENLNIIEVDGPHQEHLDYYIEKYNVDYGIDNTFIENNTMLATVDNLKIMLNDTRNAFGHGFCLAIALLDIDVSLL